MDDEKYRLAHDALLKASAIIAASMEATKQKIAAFSKMLESLNPPGYALVDDVPAWDAIKAKAERRHCKR